MRNNHFEDKDRKESLEKMVKIIFDDLSMEISTIAEFTFEEAFSKMLSPSDRESDNYEITKYAFVNGAKFGLCKSLEYLASRHGIILPEKRK